MTGRAAQGPAPDFGLRDQRGRTVRLSELLGRPVLVVFYPYAFSNVCSGELTALRDWPPMLAGDAHVLAVSCDPMFTLRAFADAEQVEYPLLSDFWPHGSVASAYGVFEDTLGCALRSTYLVDAVGDLAWSLHSPMGEARDLQEYARALSRLS